LPDPKIIIISLKKPKEMLENFRRTAGLFRKKPGGAASPEKKDVQPWFKK